MKRELGTDALGPFTSKLNLKRAREGSEFPWHQDFPYWYVAAGHAAADVVTAIVFLDDATESNGAVRVIPGSHRNGPAPRNPERSDALPRGPVEARRRIGGRGRSARRVGAVVRRVPGAPLVAEHERATPPRSVAVMATRRPAAPA